MKLNKENGLKRSQTLILPLDGVIPKRKPNNITHVVYQRVRDFRRAVVNKSWATATSLVFDSPMELSQYNIPAADFSQPVDLHIHGFVCKPIALDFQSIDEVRRTGFDLIEEAVKEVKAKATILNQMMTFIYSMPRATHQTPVKEAMCQWMVSKYPLAKVEALIKRTPEADLTDKQVARLREILSSPVAQLYRTALQEGGDSDLLALKYGVSAYEINYMRAVNAKRGSR